MKKLLFIFVAICFILSLNSFSFAETNITFAWTMENTPDLAGFNIYQRENEVNYNYDVPIAKIEDPNIREYTLNGVPDGKNLYWVLRAFDYDNLESNDSNETNQSQTGSPPAPGLNIKTVVDVNVNVNISSQ